MQEGEKKMGGAITKGLAESTLSLVRMGLTDLPKIEGGGDNAPSGPPGSGITGMNCVGR